MNMKVWLGRLGYHEHRGRTGDISYVRRLGGLAYPRFHLYLDQTHDGLALKLHLDEKQPSYVGHTAHSGQYDGELVQAEMARIIASVQ